VFDVCCHIIAFSRRALLHGVSWPALAYTLLRSSWPYRRLVCEESDGAGGRAYSVDVPSSQGRVICFASSAKPLALLLTSCSLLAFRLKISHTEILQNDLTVRFAWEK